MAGRERLRQQRVLLHATREESGRAVDCGFERDAGGALWLQNRLAPPGPLRGSAQHGFENLRRLERRQPRWHERRRTCLDGKALFAVAYAATAGRRVSEVAPSVDRTRR